MPDTLTCHVGLDFAYIKFEKVATAAFPTQSNGDGEGDLDSTSLLLFVCGTMKIYEFGYESSAGYTCRM